MVQYALDHLTQNDDQKVLGPIQDDEALFLYAIIVGMKLKRILEIGGLSGYSALNFLQAIQPLDGTVYTVDVNPVKKINENHKVIQKNALNLSPYDVDELPIDLIFFDCHDMAQMQIYHSFMSTGIINNKTILALHDTNLHYPPFSVWGQPVKGNEGIAHQPVERTMVNLFKKLGYDIFSLHTTIDKHNHSFPFRHGITVCQKFQPLAETIKNSQII